MKYIQLHDTDSVAVALEDLDQGEEITINSSNLILKDRIKAGHKFALRDISAGEPLLKYGAEIGICTRTVTAGEHIHTHNIKSQLEGTLSYTYFPKEPHQIQNLFPENTTFNGYRRQDGKVGTRNEIWIVSTVGSVAKFVERVADTANEKFKGRCDGVVALTHPFGCSQTGDDLESTRAITAALAQHPNAGGVVLIGLGCENNQTKATAWLYSELISLANSLF